MLVWMAWILVYSSAFTCRTCASINAAYKNRLNRRNLNIQINHRKGVIGDERTTRFDFVAH